MADYATLASVRAALPDDQTINDQTGRPVSATVTEWIQDTTGQVNAALTGAGIDTTTLTADQTRVCKVRCTREVVWQVMTNRGGAESNPEKPGPGWRAWHKEFEDFLKAIVDGKWPTAGAGADLVESYLGNAESDTGNSAIQPAITREMEF